MKILVSEFNGKKFVYRGGTTDENCVREVLLRQEYKNRNVPFYVEPGEVWLDLGAHIGTFTMYAYSCGVKHVTCFEGNEDNYALLEKNCPDATLYKKYFTHSTEVSLPVYKPTRGNDFYRFTVIKNKRLSGRVDNFYAGDFKGKLDGIKMDIEGSEFGLIDNRILPESSKLVMEYHFSKDGSMQNFFNRMDILRETYGKVYYQHSIEKLRDKGTKEYPGFYDIKVFCIGGIKHEIQ
jgi:FkbM family methyltransferase